MHRFGDVGLFAEAGTLENLALELEGGIVKVLGEPGVLHETVVGSLEVIGRAIASVIDQINGSGSGHDVNGQTEDEDGGADDDADEIVLEVKPELLNVVKVHLGGFD